MWNKWILLRAFEATYFWPCVAKLCLIPRYYLEHLSLIILIIN
jgi:hypothetical protein